MEPPQPQRHEATGIEVRPVRSLDELRDALGFVRRALPRIGTDWRDGDFFPQRFPDEAELMIVALCGGHIAGAALGHRNGKTGAVVAAVAVEEASRMLGIGRRLLARLEAGARTLGVTNLALGSVDESAGFYVRAGWTPALLLQFSGPEAAASRERARERFADFPASAVRDGQWHDVLQLFVRTPGVDFSLYQRVADLPGAHAGYMMSKALE
jgi:GNAT superfamily N-acetyltransferase